MKSVVVTITLTLMLTIAWVWVIRQTRGNAYFDTMALGPLAYLAPYLYAMRYTYLKTRSARAQAVFIGGTLGVVAALLLVIGLISART